MCIRDSVNVINAGNRDAESEGVEGASASKMRKAVLDNSWDEFSKLIPKGFDKEKSKKLYDTLHKKLGAAEPTTEMWRVAPIFDMINLRENFVSGNLFQVDDIVENDHTGLVGKIIRKGTNYVIAVTEDNIMFKSWIKDLSEWTDPSGVGPDQRLIGTDAHLRYVQSISHPQAYRTVAIKKFINKSREKRAKENA